MTDPVERAAAAASLGVSGQADTYRQDLAQMVMTDPEPRVRAAALGALARATGGVEDAEDDLLARAWSSAAADPDGAVRRRAAEVAPDLAPHATAVIALLPDPDPLVAEAAAFALGEWGEGAVDAGATEALSAVATSHEDALVREAAVAALGALGAPEGLDAVIAATSDRPAIRRRAVLALASFEGPEVEEALRRAAGDRDWQVRQAADDLLGPGAVSGG